MSDSDPMLQAALAYAREGIPVFPLSGKVPFKGTHGYLDATTDEATIRNWWAEHPGANIGMPTGEKTGVFVVDPDGPQGEKTLAALEAEHGALPETHEVRTGRRDGGRHLYFHQPTGIKIKSKVSLLGPKLDIKADGGHIVLPPSVHPDSHLAYSLIKDGSPAEPPVWLLDLVRDTAQKQRVNTDNDGQKIPHGKIHNWLVSQAGAYRRRGDSAEQIEKKLLIDYHERCEPPHDNEKHVREIARGTTLWEPAEEGSAFRPEIKVVQGEAPRITDEAEAVLVEHSRRLKIFQRAGEITTIIRLPKARKDSKGLRCPEGTVLLKPLSSPALMEALDRLICFQKWNAKEKNDVNTDCPARVASAYLSRCGSWKLPVLTGTITAPLMRPDGSILDAPGYDDATGLFLDSEEEWLPIPPHPTRDDAVRALETLHDPFRQFPFVGLEDKAVVIASILTALQRRLLSACPLFAFRAPQPRTGKTLLAAAPAIIATGRPASAAAVSTNQEELRKSLTAVLREGLPIINLDNIERPLKSPDLSKIITEEEFQDRLLGESTTLRLPTNCLWTATGNNLIFRGDLAQRVLLCRIDAKLQNPEQREFQIPDFKGHLRKKRTKLVQAALTILVAFHAAERPSQHCAIWGGFEEWSDLIRQSLIWAGETDPFKTRETVIEEDPEKESAVEVMQQLSKVFGESDFTARDILNKANDQMEKHKYVYPELHDALASATGRKDVEPRRLGWWLRDWRDRFAGDYKLLRANPETTHPAKWKVEY